ncbi:MAG: HEPN domain-containing protein [bacterium]
MQSYKQWMLKSGNDLRGSKVLLKEEIFDLCVYHAQQCAEKILKAYLVYKKQEIIKTHELELLVKLCRRFDDSFNILLNDAIELAPYCSKFRYPDDILIPDKEETLIVLDRSEKIYKFVKIKIIELERGQKNIFKNQNKN